MSRRAGPWKFLRSRDNSRPDRIELDVTDRIDEVVRVERRRKVAPLPKVALYPALLLLLGFGHESKIVLVAADALFPILLSTYYGASMVEQKLIWSAMAAGTPRHQILFKVVLPAAVPSILTGCRIGLVISCIVVFLAEMITSTEGLGHLLVTAARTFQAVDMFVPLITISLLGLTLNALLQALRSYLLRGFPEI